MCCLEQAVVDSPDQQFTMQQQRSAIIISMELFLHTVKMMPDRCSSTFMEIFTCLVMVYSSSYSYSSPYPNGQWYCG